MNQSIMEITKLRSITLFLIATAVGSVSAQNFEAPQTEYGHPDLQGVWNFSSTAPLERPKKYAQREFLTDEEVSQQIERRIASEKATREQEANATPQVFDPRPARATGTVNRFWMERTGLQENPRTSVIVHPKDGRIPAVQVGVLVQRGDQNGVTEIPGDRPVRYTHGGIGRNGPEDRGLSERCIVFNNGPPLFSGPYNNNIQIFQDRNYVVLLSEMGFDARIVPLNSRENNRENKRGHIDKSIEQWSGDARGYFDGDTLVVESRNFTHKVGSLSLRDVAFGSAEKRVLTERFTITGTESLEYEFTIDDPSTFTDKIVGILLMTKTDSQIYEYACHAGNYAMGNILKGARVEDNSL